MCATPHAQKGVTHKMLEDVKTTMEALTGAITDTTNNYLEKANSEREEMLDLKTRMWKTYVEFADFGLLVKEFGNTITKLGKETQNFTSIIRESLESGNYPTHRYEQND